MKKANFHPVIILLLFVFLSSCRESDDINSITIAPGDDPNFTIVANTDADYEVFNVFNRKVIVFGIPIYATSGVEDAKLLHAANVMAQYLDNDEDGSVDNQNVLTALKNNNAYMVMWKNESDLSGIIPPDEDEAKGQDLGSDETIPNFVVDGLVGEFDASLEEVLHIITYAGYATAYPLVFGLTPGTSLTNAMDVARGGHFTTIPNPYPENAWYTYDDETCEYTCMANEYIYWAITSILGAQENRSISHEWDLNTKTLVQNTDTAIYSLLTDPQYKFPTVLPDGTYKH